MLDELNKFKLESFIRENLSNKKTKPIIESHAKKISYINGEIPEDVLAISIKIINQLNRFTQNLQSLFELGIKLDIHLVGGCLRDLLSGQYKNIKDLDVLLDSYYYMNDNKHSLSKYSLSVIERICRIDTGINQTQWDELAYKQKLHILVSKILHSSYVVEKVITLEDLKHKSIANETYSHMINESLESVITIQGDESNYPMDILNINTTIKSYIEHFSFNFCKLNIEYLNSTNGTLLKTPFEFFSNINMTEDFIQDSSNKTLTVLMHKQRNVDIIKKIMDTHYIRIQEKYPSYKLVLEDGGVEEFLDFKKKFIAHLELQKTLSDNKIGKESYKIKI